MLKENMLRQAVEMRRQHLISCLTALSVNDETPFEELTLSELEREWHYYLNDLNQEVN
ncbi:Fur-regulated basic protein FbpA [Pullulanibacillus sp. KACC 23026]|uniref:Fur-regulated basic protein FbpA n=1 Tax=Pullulanibacillus sp. KACC 23026 TaxID=3028315 RepID=UPI0023B1B6DD|nr:Fur-regulated basic protein FbpA [Pullulanibacillus sp. KACC 23026]WEG13841.1 Fur-regulated basic protein FbpA [Pullulanibacillus sp. KACC 23026]